MRRRSATGAVLALALLGGEAAAQADAWQLDCAAGPQNCVLRTTMQYRGMAGGGMILGAAATHTLYATVRDDAQKPAVTVKVTDTEVRYAQLRMGTSPKTADLVCGETDCSMSFADARASIDGMKAGLEPIVSLFTNRGQMVQVRLSTVGLAAGIPKTRTN